MAGRVGEAPTAGSNADATRREDTIRFQLADMGMSVYVNVCYGAECIGQHQGDEGDVSGLRSGYPADGKCQYSGQIDILIKGGYPQSAAEPYRGWYYQA